MPGWSEWKGKWGAKEHKTGNKNTVYAHKGLTGSWLLDLILGQILPALKHFMKCPLKCISVMPFTKQVLHLLLIVWILSSKIQLQNLPHHAVSKNIQRQACFLQVRIV